MSPSCDDDKQSVGRLILSDDGFARTEVVDIQRGAKSSTSCGVRRSKGGLVSSKALGICIP